MTKIYTAWPTTGTGAGGFGDEITPDFPSGFKDTFTSMELTGSNELTVIAPTFSGFSWTGWTEQS